MPRLVWGIDFGHSSIKAVKMQRSGMLAEILDFDVVEVEHGDDESTWPARVQAALRELIQRKKVSREPVVLGIPGNQTFIKPFSLPPVQESRVSEIVRYEARQQIPFPLEEVLWDYRHSREGEEMTVDIVAVKRQIVDHILQMTKTLNLNADGIQSAPLGLFNFIRYDQEPAETTLVLDSGARITDFLVIEGDRFWFRPLAQAGNDLTRALEQKFRMSFEDAENLKLKMRESKQQEKIFQVIESVLRGLTSDIQRTIGYFGSIRRGIKLDNVIVTGGSFRLPGMVDFVGESLGRDVRALDALRRVGVAPSVDVNWFQEEFPGMGVAIGLGLQGLRLAAVDLKLLPPHLLREKEIQRKKPLIAAATLLLAATAAIHYYGLQKTHEQLDQRGTDVEKVLAQVEAKKKGLKKVEAGIPEAEFRLLRWSRIGRDRGEHVRVLDELAHLRGDGGNELIGPKTGLWITHIYVSRIPHQLGRRLDILRRAGIGESEAGVGPPPPVGPEGRRTAVARRGPRGRGGRREEVELKLEPDKPLQVVIEGEIAGPEKEDGSYAEPTLKPAYDLEVALNKVERFKGAKVWPDYRRVEVHADEGEEARGPVRRGTRAEREKRSYYLFTISWVVEKPGDILPEEE